MKNRNVSRFAILAPLAAPRARVRLAKLVPLLLEAQDQVLYLGWERKPGEIKAFAWGEGVEERAILHGGGHGSRQSRLMYPLWMAAVFRNTLRLGPNQTLYCLGWETAFPAMIASWFSGSTVIFDDADRFSRILSLPEPLNWILTTLERWTSDNVAAHIVPSFARYEWRNEKMIAVANTPSSKDIALALETETPRPSADLVLYVNGWLVETRGITMIKEAFTKLQRSEKRFALHLAGPVNTPEAKALSRCEGVITHGKISQSFALALYRASDIALTFYDPRIPINRAAEPNKWGDCVLLGVPFIVNSEVDTATDFVSNGAAWTVPYGDADALASLIESLAADPEKIVSAQKQIKEFERNFLPFDFQLIAILKQFNIL